MQDKLLKDVLTQLTRVADALEKKNRLEEKKDKRGEKLDKLDERLKKSQVAKAKKSKLYTKPNLD